LYSELLERIKRKININKKETEVKNTKIESQARYNNKYFKEE